MFVAAGTGNWTAAIFHLGTHAFFKACLFLGAGSVMHSLEHEGSHTPGDIMTMGGLAKRLPITHATFLISCLAIAGVFPFSGFFSKDEILGGAFGVHPPGWPVWYGKVLWFFLLVAALGTAFYMWRLYFLVFRGEGRSDPAKQAHESPASMTMPLVVLAVCATLAGFLGLPHLGEGEHWWAGILDRWLEPSTIHEWYASGLPGPQHITPHASAATTFILMGIALAVGLAGIGGAYLFYGRGPSKTVESLVAGPLAGVYTASKHKLWFDEVYDAIIVRPFKVVARGLFEIVDRFVIDTVAVNGAAFVIGIVGRVSRWFQNGNVQRYLVGVTVGGALVFLFTDCGHKASFDYKLVGNQLVLHAEPGDGIDGATAKVYWNLNGGDEKDMSPELVNKRDLTVTAYGGPITMIVVDPITGRETKVTRMIDLNAPQGVK
jgi:NADH-quinone oxidoreductase subunit L